jgi:pimeloyl-ACP methyl ester carboxylesterase
MPSPGVPFYFGSSDHRLFGIYHPSVQPMSDQGVVICAPTGLDYIRSHRTFQRLASVLAKRGFHVIRFDYYGCGDSAGRGGEPTIEDWHDDVHAAIEELRDMSGVTRISLFGTRLGGALAALQDNEAIRIDKLVLWDPVVKGRHYLERLEAMHRGMLSDLDRFNRRRAEDKGAYRDQLMGFPVTPAQRRAIAALDLTVGATVPAGRVLMVVSDDRADYLDYAGVLRAKGAAVDYRCLPGIGDWEELDRQGYVLFSAELVKVVAEWVTEGR